MPKPKSGITETQLNSLRELVVKEFGYPILSRSSCERLSDQIEEGTNERLSVNTLRRFFSVTKNITRPSEETLDIISRYCGFSGISELQNSFQKQLYADPTIESANRLYELTGRCDEYYQNLRSLVRLSFRDNNYQFLKNFFTLDAFAKIDDHPTKELKNLIQSFGAEMRSNPKMYNFLIDHYASNRFSRIEYFEWFVDYDFLIPQHFKGIELYIKNQKSNEDSLFGYCLLFLKAFFLKDLKTCKELIGRINSVEVSLDLHPFPLGRKMACNILFQKFSNGKVNKELIQEVFEIEKFISRNGLMGRSIPGYHVFVGEAFNWAEYYDEAISITRCALNSYSTEVNHNNGWFLNVLWMNNATALVQTNKAELSKRSFERINLNLFDIEHRNFYLMNYYHLSSRLNIHNRQLATQFKSAFLNIANSYNFQIFKNIWND
ncbi:MAG: hypothetical protein OJF59_000629 [Cytophagales bacterium]|jgi:hypothetical protein|nr:MAG: hypothetical protein OJF59_000629 [Cytophagales bacterium]